MDCEVTVYCPNDECDRMPTYRCEWESAGAGSEHEMLCECGARIAFEIEYNPIATCERIA